MAFLKSLPTTHRHLFRTNLRPGILQLALAGEMAVFLAGSEMWGCTHTEQGAEDLGDTPFPHSSHPPSALFQNSKAMNNISINIPISGYKSRKRHCTNKFTQPLHTGTCKTQTGLNQRPHKSPHLGTSA